MALFGDLGKALGLGSGEDLLPLIGTAAGFYFGGPLGASIGSGIGSLAGGKSVNDALTNAALAYGVTSFVSPQMMQNPQATGAFGSNTLQQSLYNVPTSVAQSPITVAEAANLGPEVSEYGTEMIDLADTGSTSIFDSALDFMGDNKLLTASVGSGILGLLGEEPEDETKERPYAGGEAWEVPYKGVVYNLNDPDDLRAYKEARRESFDPERRAHGGAIQGHPEAHGAMYRHDEMGYDVPVRGEVEGPGTGTSDSVPARLSDGEFVLTAKAVRGAGGGDRDIGAARMYDMMAELEATA